MSDQPPMIYVTERTQWQYKRLTYELEKESPPTSEELTKLGAEGWELTGVLADSGVGYFYLKRPTN